MTILSTIASALLSLNATSVDVGTQADHQPAQRQDRVPGPRSGQQSEPKRGLIDRMTAFHTDVPDHPFNLILVRPTADSIGVSVLTKSTGRGFVEYGPATGDAWPQRTAEQAVGAAEPVLVTLAGLKPGANRYRWCWRADGDAEWTRSEAQEFHTPRAAGDAFTFTMQADSHLDANMEPAVYERMLANAAADGPDFHIDLGDTFMTDKRPEFRDALPQYVAQRYYFAQLCRSVPLFMVLGNHDGETGVAGRGRDSSIASWSIEQRTRLFPPPVTTESAMYSGRVAQRPGTEPGSLYYTFVWGDARIIVLDPFWFTTTRPRGGGGGGGGKDSDTAPTDDNWARTLGRAQYDWLRTTLESNNARYTFVFIHHLVGGLGKANRGGMESSAFFEWGGKNADGSDGFATRREGWPMPIHDLLARHRVSAVFHGHDHLYVRAERDGVVYQCVPQPGNARGGTRSAEEYGYKAGTILASPGHVRVRVTPEQATVDFVRSAIDNAADRRGEANGAVVHSYTIAPKTGR